MAVGVVKGKGLTDAPVSNRFTSFSFDFNRINCFWDMANRIFDNEKSTFEILRTNAKLV